MIVLIVGEFIHTDYNSGGFLSTLNISQRILSSPKFIIGRILCRYVKIVDGFVQGDLHFLQPFLFYPLFFSAARTFINVLSVQ